MMGFFDKVAFWKKEEDRFSGLNNLGSSHQSSSSNPFMENPFGHDSHDPFGKSPFGDHYDVSMHSLPSGHDVAGMTRDPHLGLTNPATASTMLSQGKVSEIQQQPFSPDLTRTQMLEKDIQLISSKLDAVKATIDHMNQRLETIERIAKNQQQY
ncbi:MAG: hypothetical protein QW594_01505 [Candidatus Woesearchaeota archaeon]